MPYLNSNIDHGILKSYLERGRLTHLKIGIRKPYITLYMENNGERQNCCRFKFLRGNQYGLSMAVHTGRWEETPFTGTLVELLDLIVEKFPWMIMET